jgi:hypothetical protein
VQSIYLPDDQIAERTARHEAFWQGKLTGYPILWITAPNPKPGYELKEPATDAELWTDVEYVVQAAHTSLGQTYFAGDALPVYNPWLGPDQFAAWLGADLLLQPREFTSWASPFVADWAAHPRLEIDPQNRWWKLYLEILRRCAEFGRDKWITGYPDLHTGLDALCAARGPERTMTDLVTCPEIIQAQMRQMTRLWKRVVDEVTNIIAPYGQGTSNWTMGYSVKKFLCIGQNDFTCMIGPRMFDDFCLQDNIETCRHADYTLYHLDGPGAIKHLPSILHIKELTAVQWVHGQGSPPPGHWIKLVRQIQETGKLAQVLYLHTDGLTTAEKLADMKKLLQQVDFTKLFIWAEAPDPAQADEMVTSIKRLCRRKSAEAP